MTNKELADLIFPNITKTIEDYKKMYPKRDLPKGAIVTRYAPSPTGFIHVGALYASFVCSMFAKQTNGVFFLRIEDTDTKRTIDNGVATIINGLKDFGVTFDEGPTDDEGNCKGNYGPYIQSERKEIYQAFVKYLLEEGLAYPCFCTAEELETMREKQEKTKARIGYYGPWATCRNLSNEQRAERIKNGDPYIIRLKSNGNYNKKIICHDEIRGDLAFPENDVDIVINKSDGLPTYHFAHLVDDYLMGTTHVIRADEWVASLPLHYQLFQMFGFEVPKYAHISPLSKLEDGKMRKLSKRKDPEAAMSYYHELGIPYEGVKIYLATIANSGFEIWHAANPKADVSEYKFDFSKMSKSPALFDLDKLNFICKEYVSTLKADELYEDVTKYLETYDEEFCKLFTRDPEFSKGFLNIEREQKKPRKDIAYYSDVKKEMWYMFDELFTYSWEEEKNLEAEMLVEYIKNVYNPDDTQQEWFDKINEFGRKYGYVPMKEYKASPDEFKGHTGMICEMVRYIVTTKHMTPNLYEILRLLGKDKILNRIERYLSK